MTTAIVFEDDKPVRAFKGESCITNAYKWAHKNYYLQDEGYKIHQLPEWLKVKFYLITEEEFNNLIR